MEFTRLFELGSTPALPYAAQSVLGFVMFYMFRYFSRIYVRRFLRSWARSWLAFAIYMLSTVILMLRPPGEWSLTVSLFLNFVAQLGSYLHIVFILIGSYQLVMNKPINRRIFQGIFAITIIMASIAVLAYSNYAEAVMQRYVFRIGSRCLVAGTGFLFASILVWFNPKFTRGFGQQMLAISFLAFSIYQFLFFAAILTDLGDVGNYQATPGSRGLINLIMIATITVSMITWLLEDEREKLHKANKDLDSFIYSTSHDLRAPISSILGLTYIGKVELKEEQAKHYMDLIEQRVLKLNMILTDILRLSKTKNLEIKYERLDFIEILKETITDIQFNKGTSSIRLEYDEHADYILYSDYNQISIVLGNLITNAIKYHRLNQEDPYIKINFSRAGNTVVFSIEDNGQGIPPQSVDKIFDMYFRATQETEGTGLGLYIVKEALQKIKGKIDVTSTFGKGAKFTVTLENA